MDHDAKRHSYEEIRGAIVDLLTRPGAPVQWVSLLDALRVEMAKRNGQVQPGLSYHDRSPFHPQDAELARDAFWDLFRLGMITLGLNDDNPQWPFFRLSHLGQKDLAGESPLRFYDSGSFMALVRQKVPDISDAALIYLREAAAAFYSNLLLSACVMLGVAAEAEFLRVVDVAAAHPTWGSRFNSAEKASFVATKIEKFQRALETIRQDLPKHVTENLDVLSAIQTVIRLARNDAGHPVANSVSREQVYVYLQMFIHMAAQMQTLRSELAFRNDG